MENYRPDRRDFLKAAAGVAALSAGPPALASSDGAPRRIRFAVIGINHAHIYGQVGAVQAGGGELVSVHAKEPDLLAGVHQALPAGEARRAQRERDPRGRLGPARAQLRSSPTSARRSASA